MLRDGSGQFLEEDVFKHDRLHLEKTAWRKLDCYILPIATMFYLLSFLVGYFLVYLLTTSFTCITKDRSNVGNARVAGMQKDLHMTNNQVCLSFLCTEVEKSYMMSTIGVLVQHRPYSHICVSNKKTTSDSENILQDSEAVFSDHTLLQRCRVTYY
jgi:Fe2+ transport system protein B